MTAEEYMEYIRNCPYDAMGDFSTLFNKELEKTVIQEESLRDDDSVDTLLS